MLIKNEYINKELRIYMSSYYSEVGNMQTIMLSYEVYWSIHVLGESKHMENDSKNVI